MTVTHDGHLYEPFELSEEDKEEILRFYRAIAWQFFIHGEVSDKPYHWSKIHLVEHRDDGLEDLLTLCGRFTANHGMERIADIVEGYDAYDNNNILPCAICHYIWNLSQSE